MMSWTVTMARAGGGSGVFRVVVNAATPDGARKAAEAQNPGYKAISVKTERQGA
jgi:hypothetical protein